MMASLLQACALFLLISICRAQTPSMEPEGPKLALTEGDRLLIKCHSSDRMKFLTDLFQTEKATESIEEETAIAYNLYTRSFEKKSVVPEDSGWYGCAIYGVMIDPDTFDQPGVKWIFVFIKPMKPSMEQSGPILNLVEGDELFINCSSYQQMTFYTILDKPDEWSDSSEEGSASLGGEYTLALKKKSVVQGDSGWYGCAYSDVKVDTSNHDQPQVNWINVIVKPKA
ncbi:uncharacterized protein LOC130677847 [Microplitis mediator]|uniref:uncharacterized protein LOC130677847 n=1 Tax=Microplitis mediator TaxID=375433 RepID=UPI002555E575|nr:uncharacterized protein LOC130677847 [Microplitis mediator]XP_057340717.1 uncharacterized protein LOC130677847 [Microplitis mediator]